MRFLLRVRPDRARLASRNAGELRAPGSCHASLSACRRWLVFLADRGGDLGDPLAGAGLAGRVLVPAAERGFDPAGADPGAAGGGGGRAGAGGPGGGAGRGGGGWWG